MLQSIIHDTRGVSEVVASLMIILAFSIAGAALYSYSTDVFSSSWSSFLLETNRRGERAQERLSVIAIWWDNGDQFNLTILNYGKIELSIDAVYIDGNWAPVSEGRGTVVVRRGKIQVKFTSPVPIQDGQIYEINAVSARGSRHFVSWKA